MLDMASSILKIKIKNVNDLYFHRNKRIVYL